MSDVESRRLEMLESLGLEVPCLETLALIQRLLDSEDEEQKEARRKIFKTESFELKVASLDPRTLNPRKRLLESGDEIDHEHGHEENDRTTESLKDEKLESLLDKQSQREIDRKKESLNEEKKLESFEDEIKKNESLKKENQKEVAETQSWTQNVPERKMSDDETSRLAIEEKEKALEMLEKQLDEREKEIDRIEDEMVKKDKEKAAKEAKKKEKRKNLRKLKKKLEEALEGSDDIREEVVPTSPESVIKKRKKTDKKKTDKNLGVVSEADVRAIALRVEVNEYAERYFDDGEEGERCFEDDKDIRYIENAKELCPSPSKVMGGGGLVAKCQTRPPVQAGDPPHLPGHAGGGGGGYEPEELPEGEDEDTHAPYQANHGERYSEDNEENDEEEEDDDEVEDEDDGEDEEYYEDEEEDDVRYYIYYDDDEKDVRYYDKDTTEEDVDETEVESEFDETDVGDTEVDATELRIDESDDDNYGERCSEDEEEDDDDDEEEDKDDEEEEDEDDEEEEEYCEDDEDARYYEDDERDARCYQENTTDERADDSEVETEFDETRTEVDDTEVVAKQVDADNTEVIAKQVDTDNTEVLARQAAATEVIGTKVAATEADTAVIDTAEVDATQVADAVEVDATVVNATEVGNTEVSVDDRRFVEESAFEENGHNFAAVIPTPSDENKDEVESEREAEKTKENVEKLEENCFIEHEKNNATKKVVETKQYVPELNPSHWEYHDGLEKDDEAENKSEVSLTEESLDEETSPPASESASEETHEAHREEKAVAVSNSDGVNPEALNVEESPATFDDKRKDDTMDTVDKRRRIEEAEVVNIEVTATQVDVRESVGMQVVNSHLFAISIPTPPDENNDEVEREKEAEVRIQGNTSKQSQGLSLKSEQYEQEKTEEKAETLVEDTFTEHEENKTPEKHVEKVELEAVERAATGTDEETEVGKEEQATAERSFEEETAVNSTNSITKMVELEIVPRTKTTTRVVAETFGEDHFTEPEENDVDVKATASEKIGQNSADSIHGKAEVGPEETPADRSPKDEKKVMHERDAKNTAVNKDVPELYPPSAMGGGGQVATCHMSPSVQPGDPPHLPGQVGGGGGDDDDAEQDSRSEEKESKDDDHREKEHQNAEKVEINLISRRKVIRRGSGRAAVGIDEETKVEAVEQATAGTSSKEETAVASGTEEPNAGEVECKVVPRAKTARREVTKTNKDEGLAQESLKKETLQNNPEGGTTGRETKEAGEEAPPSEECHELHQKAPGNCMRTATSEESNPLLPNFTPEDEETEVKVEEEMTAERSTKDDTAETSRTKDLDAGTEHAEDDAFAHGKESECLLLNMKKIRILSEERSKAHTSARDGRSQLPPPTKERLRQALMFGKAFQSFSILHAIFQTISVIGTNV